MRKKVFFSGALIALSLLIISTPTFAQGLRISNDEAQTMRTEIAAGKPVREVLTKHNISMQQIMRAMKSLQPITISGKKISRTQIATAVRSLGINPQEVQKEILAGTNFQDILKKYNLSEQDILNALEKQKTAKK